MPAYIRFDGIDGEVVEAAGKRTTDSFVFARASTGDDVVVDGRIITAENWGMVPGEDGTAARASLNFTKIEFTVPVQDDAPAEPGALSAADAAEVGGVQIGLGDSSVRFATSDADVF